MTYPIVRFVSAPAVDAEVRFDFNTAGEWSDDETWPEHEGFSLGVPTLEGDPDAYGVEYGLRELSFNVIIDGTYAHASSVWSRLAKELVNRRSNWLLFQFSEFSRPVWFRTYRSAPDALDFEQVYGTDDIARNLWGVGITLAAEPFAYGERVTIPTFTVNNDPAASSNPCFTVLPEILGDAPAPARYDMTTAALQSIPAPMFAVTPVDDTFDAPLVYQIGTADDGVTTYTDTGDPIASTTYSMGVYRDVTFATAPQLTRRIRRPLLGVRPGRYVAMIRVGRSAGSASTYTFQAVLNGRVEGPVRTLERPSGPGIGYRQWVDLGTFTIPMGMADYDSTTPIDTLLDIRVGRLTGASVCALDVIVLVPVEHFEGEPGARMTTYPDFLGDAASSYLNRWDGDEGYHQIYRNGHLLQANPAYLKGEFPPLVPGRQNVFHLFRHTDSAAREDGVNGDQRATTDNANADVLTMQTAVTISYHPRWLWLAP